MKHLSIKVALFSYKSRKPPTNPIARLLLLLLLWLGMSAAAPAVAATDRQETDRQETGRMVYVLTFEGAVTPVLESYLGRAIEAAQTEGAEAVILRLDTPGGSVDVTKSIIQQMLASPAPIVVYVAPAGAHAGSAGTFVTLAAHIAAMAPGTSIGAASPVDISGGDIDETLQAKITNILRADIENLAARRGEEATRWAIAAVQEAAAATADEALELGVIDLVASDLPELLRELDGRTVTVAGAPRTLHTADARIVEMPLTTFQELLNFLADPTVAAILLSLGILGLVVEIRTPGFGVPGILGALALLMAFYGLGQLDANLAGLALMGVALLLFVGEAFTPTFGALALGGVIAFILGAALLFDTPGVRVPWTTVILLALGMGAVTVFAGSKALAAQRTPVTTGSEGLIGRIATAKAAFSAGEEGSVFVQGEWWTARLTTGRLEPGQRAQVVGRDGLTLIVTPLS
ncbi:MAG TPA: nodulation protein NfeD [Caldilineaceae bacterium]|nr:nodulation protein NfeD [Caldilineaceae bacterium]